MFGRIPPFVFFVFLFKYFQVHLVLYLHCSCIVLALYLYCWFYPSFRLLPIYLNPLPHLVLYLRCSCTVALYAVSGPTLVFFVFSSSTTQLHLVLCLFCTCIVLVLLALPPFYLSLSLLYYSLSPCIVLVFFLYCRSQPRCSSLHCHLVLYLYRACAVGLYSTLKLFPFI